MNVALTDTTDEAYLVKCCKDNNPAAQKILFNKYAEDMMLLCLRYIDNEEDAREALMDGFLGFFKNIGSFAYQGSGSVKAWLKKIVVNQCLMQLRKKQPVYVAEKEITAYEDKESADDILGHLGMKEILHLVHSLPEGYRAVFNLYVFEGFNHREIGAMLNISEQTSKSQLHRAKELLKKKIVAANQ